MLAEGVAEGRRPIRREPPPEVFDGTGGSDFNTVVEAPTDSLAWRDQAWELVELGRAALVQPAIRSTQRPA